MTKPLALETAQLIDDIIDAKVQNRECFYALDVSNAVKQRGMAASPPKGFGSHNDMAEVVRLTMSAVIARNEYDARLVEVDDGKRLAFLYFPWGTPEVTIQSHVNRKVVALPPVELVMTQVSQQATGQQVTQPTTPLRTSAPATLPKQGLGQHVWDFLRGLVGK